MEGKLGNFVRLGSRIINVDCLRQCVNEGEDHQVVLLFTGGAKHTLRGKDALRFWIYIQNKSEDILTDDNEGLAL